MQTDILSMLASQRPKFADSIIPAYAMSSGISGLDIQRSGSVDLSEVRGIWHPDYANHTWAELIGAASSGARPCLKKLRDCLDELRANPGYYLLEEHKPGWSFYKVGDDYYLTEGNHRLVVGRFFLELNGFPPVVHGVAVKTVNPMVWWQRQTQAFPLPSPEESSPLH